MMPPPNHTWPTEWQRMGCVQERAWEQFCRWCWKKPGCTYVQSFSLHIPAQVGISLPLSMHIPQAAIYPSVFKVAVSLTWFHFNKLLRETNAIGAFHTPHTGRAGTALIFTSPRPLLLANLHISPPGFLVHKHPSEFWIMLRAVGAEYKASGTNVKLKTL